MYPDDESHFVWENENIFNKIGPSMWNHGKFTILSVGEQVIWRCFTFRREDFCFGWKICLSQNKNRVRKWMLKKERTKVSLPLWPFKCTVCAFLSLHHSLYRTHNNALFCTRFESTINFLPDVQAFCAQICCYCCYCCCCCSYYYCC